MSPEPLDGKDEANGYINGKSANHAVPRSRKKSHLGGLADVKSEAFVVTDSEASMANEKNMDLSDYSENSESSEDTDSEDKIETRRRQSISSLKSAGSGPLVDESVIKELSDPATAKQAYISVTGTEPPFGFGPGPGAWLPQPLAWKALKSIRWVRLVQRGRTQSTLRILAWPAANWRKPSILF